MQGLGCVGSELQAGDEGARHPDGGFFAPANFVGDGRLFLRREERADDDEVALLVLERAWASANAATCELFHFHAVLLKVSVRGECLISDGCFSPSHMPLVFLQQISHYSSTYMSNIFNIDVEHGGFNKTQKSLVRTLSATGRPLSIRALEERLGAKRLTIYYNLKQLRKRKVVRQDRTGKIYTWSLVPTEAEARVSEVPIDRAYDTLARSPAKRLWGIQGGLTIREIVNGIGKGVTYRPIHHRQRLRKIVVDGILTQAGVEWIKRAPVEELSSHFHRPTILHVAVDTPELDYQEIITDGEKTIIIDRRAQKAFLLKDRVVAEGYIALHETIKALSVKAKPQEVYGEIMTSGQ